MANKHLTFDPVTKHLVRNHANATFYGNTRAKNLRLGRYHFLNDIFADRACTQCTGSSDENGLYLQGSSSAFNGARMVTALNNALGYNYASNNLSVGLSFMFWQDWNAYEWNGSSWIVPPVYHWYEYCTATCVRYRYSVPAALQTSDVQKVFIEIPSMGMTTGQFVNYCQDGGGYTLDNWWNPEQVTYLSNLTMGFNVYLSSSAPAKPSSAGQVFGVQIPINTGTSKMNESPVVPIRFDPNMDYSVWSEPNDTGGRYIQLDLPATAIKSLFSGAYVYVMLSPYITSYPFMGTVKPYPTSSMYPNTASVVGWNSNRTTNFGQDMSACFYGGPQLGVYSK